MTIRWDSRLLGVPVFDQDGRRLGRVAAAYCTPDPYTVVWFVLRLPGVRRRWRAVPAEGARWNAGAGTGLWVPLRGEQVLASPVVDGASLDPARGEVEAFYADGRLGHADDRGERSRHARVLIPRDNDVLLGGARAPAPSPAWSPTTTRAYRRVRRQRAVR